MNSVTEPLWPTVILAAVLLVDAVLSVRPPAFISDCLNGVNLPRDYWWALVMIKLLAAAGLVAGIAVDGVGLAANIGVVAYFVAAATAHVRAKFFGPALWVNCCGMLALSVATLVYTYGF